MTSLRNVEELASDSVSVSISADSEFNIFSAVTSDAVCFVVSFLYVEVVSAAFVSTGEKLNRVETSISVDVSEIVLFIYSLMF